jgi:hypothetical protein
MLLSPAERLILLKLTHILERIDPAHAKQHDADAQALELGSPAGLAAMFEVLDLEPASRSPCAAQAPRPQLRLVHSAD